VTVPRALLLALALLQATGVAEAMRRAVCEIECRDDGCEDDCSPVDSAPTCHCHSPGTPSLPAPVVAVATRAPLPVHAVTFDRRERTHANPDPHEILHVPRTVG
jgi:hypothetical protein